MYSVTAEQCDRRTVWLPNSVTAEQCDVIGAICEVTGVVCGVTVVYTVAVDAFKKS